MELTYDNRDSKNFWCITGISGTVEMTGTLGTGHSSSYTLLVVLKAEDRTMKLCQGCFVITWRMKVTTLLPGLTPA
jgi:hypothetical protein